jgi:hypothetical protein
MVESRDIDRACDSAAKYANRHESAARTVADVSGAVLAKKNEGTWKVFKNPKEMEGVGDDGAPNSQARVWVTPDRMTFVDAFFQSGSGDWAQFVAYCYRPDGTLARSKSTYNTFLTEDGDGVSVIRVRHYDPTGKIVGSQQKVLDLKTKKPVHKARFGDQPEPLFLKTEDLPFWALVGTG